MKRIFVLAIVWTFAVSALPATSGEPIPRTPLAPGLFREQGPTFGKDSWWAMRPDGYLAPNLSPFGGTAQPVEAQVIAIHNPMAKGFIFAIWDPSSEDWQQFEATQGRTDVKCPLCVEKARLSFHNGREQLTYSVKLGHIVTIDWAPSAKIWILSQDSNLVTPEGAFVTNR